MTNQVKNNTGSNIGMEYLITYPINEGIFIPDCSAIDFTMKLGAFPMYVNAPKNTEATEIANKNPEAECPAPVVNSTN